MKSSIVLIFAIVILFAPIAPGVRDAECSCHFMLESSAASPNTFLRMANCNVLPKAASGGAFRIHSGWITAPRGGVFVRSDGDALLVGSGSRLGLRDAHPITGAWVGLTRTLTLASSLKLFLESWVVIPNRIGAAIKHRGHSRVSPRIIGGVSIAARF